MATQIVRFLSALVLAWIPTLASAQILEPPQPIDPAGGPLLQRNAARPGDNAEPIELFPSIQGTREELYLPEWLHPRAEATQLLNFGERSLGVTELEAKVGFDVPILDDKDAPLRIVPGIAWRWFEGPTSPSANNRPDMPPWVSDFYVDFMWRPRLAEWLFIDMKLTPGFYSDLHNTSSDAFRLRGHGMAIIALSEKFQILLGAAYVNRYNFKLVPIGGIRWLPNEDTELRLLCPAPRISHRIATCGETKIKIYMTGEYGGGFWAVRREDGRDDLMDYSDYRLLAGVEGEMKGDRRWYAEIGYIFNRRIDYTSVNPNTFRPTDTMLLRAGITY